MHSGRVKVHNNSPTFNTFNWISKPRSHESQTFFPLDFYRTRINNVLVVDSIRSIPFPSRTVQIRLYCTSSRGRKFGNSGTGLRRRNSSAKLYPLDFGRAAMFSSLHFMYMNLQAKSGVGRARNRQFSLRVRRERIFHSDVKSREGFWSRVCFSPPWIRAVSFE